MLIILLYRMLSYCTVRCSNYRINVNYTYVVTYRSYVVPSCTPVSNAVQNKFCKTAGVVRRMLAQRRTPGGCKENRRTCPWSRVAIRAAAGVLFWLARAHPPAADRPPRPSWAHWPFSKLRPAGPAGRQPPPQRRAGTGDTAGQAMSA